MLIAYHQKMLRRQDLAHYWPANFDIPSGREVTRTDLALLQISLREGGYIPLIFVTVLEQTACPMDTNRRMQLALSTGCRVNAR